MDIKTIAVVVLAAGAVAGVAWVFIYPILSGERTTEQRVDSVAKSTATRGGAGRGQVRSRREQVEDTLKDLEARNRNAKNPPLSTRIMQAGLDWSKKKFFIVSGAIGAAAFMAAFSCFRFGQPLDLALALVAAGVCAFGVPQWLLRFLRKRREAKFISHVPDAVDVIVRGVKSGLPLLDSIKVIIADSPEPVCTEFRVIIETQAIGIPLGDACAKMYERMPLAEANFFGIVVAIQQRAGGNLSEALGNLSRVLRDRKRMKEKIVAMSMEAKASAAIIGALPLIVMFLVYLTSPGYITLLWTDTRGLWMLAASAFWMTTGVVVMKKMINFDF